MDFSLLAGERLIKDFRAVEEQITDLLQGRRYFFRVYCGNIFGFGPPRSSVPPSVVPSSRAIISTLILICGSN
jgi:hypothetical protein